MAQDYNLDNISVNLENFSLKRHFYYIFDDDDNDDDDDDKERRTTTKMTKFKATATKKITYRFVLVRYGCYFTHICICICRFIRFSKENCWRIYHIKKINIMKIAKH